MTVDCATLDGSDPQAVIETAKVSWMASNSLRRGLAVHVEAAAAG